MPLPNHYDAEKVGAFFAPDIPSIVQASTKAGQPVEQSERGYLLLIDVQFDFVHPDGTLSIPGAVDDTRRLIEWLYSNLGLIRKIGASLDTHVPMQIFYPEWWVNDDGEHPAPFTQITAEATDTGAWKPLIDPEWSLDYLRQLEQNAKKTHTIWPYHTMVGTKGHAMMPALYEAVTYHTALHGTPPTFLVKGRLPQTEHYSALETEVKIPEDPASYLNTTLLDEMAQYDTIYIAGQAKSHCVLETVNSLVSHYEKSNPAMLEKIVLLEDCMSSVQHPTVDFEAIAVEAFRWFHAKGVQITTT